MMLCRFALGIGVLSMVGCTLSHTGEHEGAGAVGAGTATGGASIGGAGAAPHGGSGGSGGSSSGSGGSTQGTCDSGFVCVPETTAGALVRASGGQASCDGPWQSPTSYAPPQQPGCACACGTPTPGTCTAGSFSGYADDDCTLLHGYAPQSNCPSLGNGVHGSFKLFDSTPSDSTCAVTSTGKVAIDETTLCSLASAPTVSCGAGKICVPQGSGSLCNLLANGASCAAGYGTPVQLAKVIDDTRNCNCTCGPSSGQTCNASADIFAAGGCVGSPVDTVPSNGLCTDTVDSNGSVDWDFGTWTGGSCAPNPTSGSVLLDTTELLCCLL